MRAKTLSSMVGRLLRKNLETLATAESCTGGLLGHLITETPGSSGYYRGGVVAYSNKSKELLLGVSSGDLRRHGAVSAPVAGQMAKRVRRLLKTDYGLAVTGIAGPGGGSKRKPVGLVFLALATAKRTHINKYLFHGSRTSIKARSAQKALDFLRQELL